MPQIECPKCREGVDVSAADFGRTVNCGSCGAIFPAVETLENQMDFERRAKFERGQRLLQGRSRALVTASIAALIGSCSFGAVYFFAGSERIFWMNWNDAENLMIFGAVTAVLGSVYCLLILIGASRMKHPHQRNWPIFSSVLAIAAIFLCWPIPIFSLPLCMYGVWAMRRLYHPEVLEAAAIKEDFQNSPNSHGLESTDPQQGISGYFSDRYDPVDSEDRTAVLNEAKRLVRVPATGLKVTGVVGMVAAVIVGFIVTLEQLNGWRDQTENAILSFGTFVAITFYFFLVAAGGRALGRLQNRVLSYTAAILGTVTMAFIGVMTVISIPGIIFGAWSLAALHTREVTHAMRWKRQEREDRHTL